MIRRLFFVMAFAVLPVLAGLPAAARDAAAREKANVDGFRSAKFGMDEAAVRRAAGADFGKAAAGIAVETHPLERTKILSLAADELVPGSGPARISYVFGFSSRKLTQVNVVWAGAAMTDQEVDRLRNLALTLQAYFLQRSFAEDSVATEGSVADGTQVAFRGLDEKGRMVLLRYFLGRADDKAKAEVPFVNLSYFENPKNPDVFRLQPGQF